MAGAKKDMGWVRKGEIARRRKNSRKNTCGCLFGVEWHPNDWFPLAYHKKNMKGNRHVSFKKLNDILQGCHWFALTRSTISKVPLSLSHIRTRTSTLARGHERALQRVKPLRTSLWVSFVVPRVAAASLRKNKINWLPTHGDWAHTDWWRSLECSFTPTVRLSTPKQSVMQKILT